jgi:uncharacterized protein YhfF/DNA-binding CsgD family transcriptional regulator
VIVAHGGHGLAYHMPTVPNCPVEWTGAGSMRSARIAAFWQAYRRHEGPDHDRFSTAYFRTPADTSESLIDWMCVGVKRCISGATVYLREEASVPRVGDYAVLLDHRSRPRLIWRTTSMVIAPFSSVTDEFVWHDGTGNGDRAEWLRIAGESMTLQGHKYGFEMHNEIETFFETVEVVWPHETAKRIRLVAPGLDRGLALLKGLNERRNLIDGLEAILSRVQTAVLTVGPGLGLAFANRAAETMLRCGDGLRVKSGRLTAHLYEDENNLQNSILAVCSGELSHRPDRSAGTLIRIERSENRPPYRVSVFPLHRSRPALGVPPGAEAMLFVDDPCDDAVPVQADLYATAFRLTPAEARLAVHLASGASLTEAASIFRVTHNTVRAQLRGIFDKTDLHRQTDLVRMLQNSRSLRVSLS